MAKKKPTSKQNDSGESKRVKAILRALNKRYLDAECALTHDSPFQLLTATILSAQCTDERVNATTPTLFRRYPTAEKLAKAKIPDVEKIVNPLGFFRS
jgi:endonuclease-3